MCQSNLNMSIIIAFIIGLIIMHLVCSNTNLVRCHKCKQSTFENNKENEDLVNNLLSEKFTNKDVYEAHDSYENKHLFEQKVYQMLSPANKKKYLDLPTAEKDMYLNNVAINRI